MDEFSKSLTPAAKERRLARARAIDALPQEQRLPDAGNLTIGELAERFGVSSADESDQCLDGKLPLETEASERLKSPDGPFIAISFARSAVERRFRLLGAKILQDNLDPNSCGVLLKRLAADVRNEVFHHPPELPHHQTITEELKNAVLRAVDQVLARLVREYEDLARSTAQVPAPLRSLPGAVATVADGAAGPGQGVAWEAIRLRFLDDDHSVEILVAAGVARTLKYDEIPGFQDNRTGKPNGAWTTLRTIGRAGNIPESARTGKDWIRIQKQVERTRKALRLYFNKADDPLPYVEGIGYRARIKIMLPEAL